MVEFRENSVIYGNGGAKRVLFLVDRNNIAGRFLTSTLQALLSRAT
jgi:hypothetical protein